MHKILQWLQSPHPVLWSCSIVVNMIAMVIAARAGDTRLAVAACFLSLLQITALYYYLGGKL